MKFKINREQFQKGLSIASRPTTAKSPMPILGNIYLTLNETGLTLLSSSNELAIKTHIPIRVNDLEVIRIFTPGETLISAKTLNESIRKMEGNEINVEIIDRTIAQISDGRTEYRLGALDTKDYPDLDLSQTGTSFEIKTRDFLRLVEQTSFAASTKEQRPILTAVNLSAHNGSLTAVATDSARLANKVVDLKDNVTFVANVPARILNEIAKLLETMPGIDTLEVTASANKINFVFDNTLLVSRLIAGEYPPTRNIIPKTHTSFLQANANELLKAMDRVSILYGADKDNVVKLSLSEDGVIVSARSSFSAESAKEEVPLCKYGGDKLEISFNHVLASSAIKATQAEEVIIGFNGGNKPFSIKVAEDDSLVLIVTPVRS